LEGVASLEATRQNQTRLRSSGKLAFGRTNLAQLLGGQEEAANVAREQTHEARNSIGLERLFG